MFLVDSSVWVEVFRKRRPLDIEAALDFDEIVTCLPVVQEVLQGFDDPTAFNLARESMLSLPMVESPLTQEVFDEAVTLYRSARRLGKTVRSGVDCVIAACGARNALTIVHRDRDFDALAKVAPLEVWNLGD